MGGSWTQWGCGLVAASGLLWLTGCDRLGGGPGSEQRETSFVEGQNFAIQGQKEKAIASFEQAVLANPSNASAHLALGDLYYGQLEFIDAAYHYHRYVQLMERRGQRPDISAGDNLRNCEMQLAIKFSRELSRQQNDLEIENLRRQITEKEGTIQQLRGELLQRSPTNQVAIAAGGGTSSRPPTADPNTVSRPGTPSPSGTVEPVVSGGSTNRPAPSGTAERTRPASGKSHAVRSGETPSIIARKYGITVKALMAANPGVSPNRLKVGTVLKLP